MEIRALHSDFISLCFPFLTSRLICQFLPHRKQYISSTKPTGWWCLWKQSLFSVTYTHNIPKHCAHRVQNVRMLKMKCKWAAAAAVYSRTKLLHDSQQGQEVFVLSKGSRRALEATQPPTPWVSGEVSPRVTLPGREADHSPASSVQVVNKSSYTWSWSLPYGMQRFSRHWTFILSPSGL